MFQKLLDFLKKNKVQNLYTVHMESKGKQGIYSLTHPILPPEAEITTFFDKPTFIGLSPEEQLSHKLTLGRKVSSFGAIMNNEEQRKPTTGKNPNVGSFGESFNTK